MDSLFLLYSRQLYNDIHIVLLLNASFNQTKRFLKLSPHYPCCSSASANSSACMHVFDVFFHFALLLSQISLESFCFLAWAKKEGCASFPANAFHFSGERFLFCKYNTVKGNYQWKHRAACPVCGIYLQGTRIYAYSSTSLGEL